MRSESRAGLPALPSREEGRANGPNSEAGQDNTEKARVVTRGLKWSVSGTEDWVSQPLPTRAKRIEDAAIERRVVDDICTDGHSV